MTALVESRAIGPSDVEPTQQPRPPRVPRRRVALLVGLVCLGATLRLRWSHNFGLSFDETFTAMAGRKPLPDLFTYLATSDSHPPLDYLLRAPFARAGASNFWLRAPSLLFSVSGLALLAWWLRRLPITAVIATGVMAVSGFEIAYGSEARMYALLELLGVTTAVVAAAWLRAPRDWHAWAVAGLVFVGCLDHVSMFLLVPGLLLLAGTRRDREAWRWRAGAVAGVAAWLPLWGPQLLEQARGGHSSWIPRTSARGVVDTVVSLVTFTDGVTWLVVAGVVAGSVWLWRSDRALGRVVLACAALPVALAAAVGVFAPFFSTRTLALVGWAPALAIGVTVEHAWRFRRVVGVLALVAVVFVLVPGTVSLLNESWEYDVTITRVEAVARPGDLVAVVPSWYSQLVAWRIGVRGPVGPAHEVKWSGIEDAVALRLDGAPATGRLWLLEYGSARPSLRGYRTCSEPWTYVATRVVCLDVSADP